MSSRPPTPPYVPFGIRRFDVVCVLLLLPVMLYVGIVIANDCIAGNIGRSLTAAPLPENTVLLDPVCLAGKLTGNGNGMQYMGSIFVVSDLTQAELTEHFNDHFGPVEVRKQESPVIDFIDTDKYSFELFADPEHNDHYSITCWASPETIGVGDLIAALLDLDMRGH